MNKTNNSCYIRIQPGGYGPQWFWSFQGIPFNILINTAVFMICVFAHMVQLSLTNYLRSKGRNVLKFDRNVPSFWQSIYMHDIELAKYAGIDGVAYLRSLKSSMLQMMIFSPLLFVIIPLYHHGDSSASSFVRWTISNLNLLDIKSAWVLWTFTLCCALAYLVLILYQLAYVYKWPKKLRICASWNPGAHGLDNYQHWKEDTGDGPMCQCTEINQVPNVLLLSGVPLLPEDQLHKELVVYFSGFEPAVNIKWISLVRDWSTIVKLERKIHETTQLLEICKDRFEQTNIRLGYRTSRSTCCLSPCVGTTKDAIEFYSNEIDRLHTRLEQQKSIHSTSLHPQLPAFTGMVFVAVGSGSEAIRVANHFSNCCTNSVPSMYQLHTLSDRGEIMVTGAVHSKIPFKRIQIAPMPEDILWLNLMSARRDEFCPHFGSACRSFGIFILALILTSPSYVLAVLNSINAVADIKKVFGFVVYQWVPALLLVAASALVKQLVILSENWFKHKTFDVQEKIGQRRLFAFLVITILILPSFGVSGLPALLKRLYTSNDELGLRFECIYTPDSAVLFANYVTTCSLIGSGVLLLQFGRLFQFICSYFTARSEAEKILLAKTPSDQFPFRERYATLALIQVIVIAYAPIAPIILLFGLFYAMVDYIVCKYAMVRLFSNTTASPEYPAEEAQRSSVPIYHVTWFTQVISCSSTGVCLACFNVCVFFALRLNMSGIQPVAFSSLLLTGFVVIITALWSVNRLRRWILAQLCCFPVRIDASDEKEMDLKPFYTPPYLRGYSPSAI